VDSFHRNFYYEGDGNRTELLRHWFKQKSVAPEECREYVVNAWNNTSGTGEEDSRPRLL